MKQKKKTSIVIIILLVLIIVSGLVSFIYINDNLKPVSNNAEEYKIITIQDNWYGKNVLAYLEDENIIKNADLSYYYARYKNYDMSFKAGMYEVSPSWSLEELINYLSDGNNTIQDTVEIKFVEGSRVKDFADLIAQNTNLNYDSLIDYWNNTDVLKELINKYSFLTEDIFDEDINYNLEGYLFPDTYEFFVNTSEKEVTEKILNKTQSVFDQYKEYFDQSEYSIHEIFTLASIIQRESSNSEDMKNVSSVFYNRLNIGMRLQSSVTVCYALDIGLNDDWTKCEITQEERNPYNTYQVDGFTPGPICMPSKNAIEAALMPNETNYYFFIGDVCQSGKTYFAETYQEQLENQARYLTCY